MLSCDDFLLKLRVAEQSGATPAPKPWRLKRSVDTGLQGQARLARGVTV